ncbi:hypothetical protein MPER_09233, partial [Moniliophthora perniciosa FA553]
IPVIPHKPWVMRNASIPPGIYKEVCDIIKGKIFRTFKRGYYTTFRNTTSDTGQVTYGMD